MGSRRWLVRTFAAGAAIGVAVAVALLARLRLTGGLAGEFELSLWPSSILLLAYDGAAGFDALMAWTLSIGINALLYSLVAVAVVWFVRSVRSHSVRP